MKIKFKKINPEIELPKKQSNNAVCVDVTVSELLYCEEFPEYVTVKLGFSTEIPNGYKGCIVPRSSFTQKGWIMQNSPAQIDSDYRGEWMIKFEAIPIGYTEFGNNYVDEGKFHYDKFPYNVGDRCAQIYFEKELEYEFEVVEELSDTTRGNLGFGSSGK